MKILKERPIAERSADFAIPRGSAQDNTHCPAFWAKCNSLRPGASLLDLGCSGGGLVADFLTNKCYAVGVDGHQMPAMRENSEWLKFPHNFTFADITGIFQIFSDDGYLTVFDVVSAWEVLEHIHERDLPIVFQNIRRHLGPNSFFIGSVSTISDLENGLEYHPTIHDQIWWTRMFESHGLRVIDWRDYFSRSEMPRGSGNPLATGDWSGNEGFHIMAIL